ncbi:MAG: DUF465 domain-containing protein [Acidobacteria bacterium]|nr:DUF465 domain-containing protein [Acidobacteriota bacterium]
MPEDALRDRLLQEDDEYRELAAEHRKYERQLEDLTRKHFLSEDEELLEKTLKKKKLVLKDKMHFLVQRQRR